MELPDQLQDLRFTRAVSERLPALAASAREAHAVAGGAELEPGHGLVVLGHGAEHLRISSLGFGTAPRVEAEARW